MKPFKKIKENILIGRIRSGDNDAFSLIYDEYSQRIYRFILFKVSDDNTAEDLMSDSFLKCWRYISETDKPIENLQALLYSIARNTVIDFYRTRNQPLPLSEINISITDQSEEVVEMIHNNQELQQLLKYLPRLPDEYNEIIALRYIEDLQINEIANILGKSDNNVRVTLHRALKSLKKLTNQFDEK